MRAVSTQSRPVRRYAQPPGQRSRGARLLRGSTPRFRTYANNNRYPWTPSHDRWPVVEAPTGITFVGYENPPGVTSSEHQVRSFLDSDRAAWYHHVNITAHDHGGHFIPWEIPDEWADDLRRTFRGRR